MPLSNYHRFKAYAESLGIQLLKDDLRFIDTQLLRYSENESRAILRDYINEWLHGKGEEDNPTLNQNSGRFRANKWLLTRVSSDRPAETPKNKKPVQKERKLSTEAEKARLECLEKVGLLKK